MSLGAPRFSSFRCSAEQSRKDKGPGCCPKPPQSATPHVHRPWAAITLFGEEPEIERSLPYVGSFAWNLSLLRQHDAPQRHENSLVAQRQRDPEGPADSIPQAISLQH